MKPENYNALASAPSAPAKPVYKKPATPTKGLNSKPDKSANAGQMPALMGDVKKNPKPTISQAQILPSTAPARAAGAPEQRSGIETSMSALADKMHPPKRR